MDLHSGFSHYHSLVIGRSRNSRLQKKENISIPIPIIPQHKMTTMKIRDKIITFNVHSLALPVVKKFVPRSPIPFTMEELQQLPTGSLGNELFHFLTKHHFSFLPHFETHDVKHVLLNYGISGKDEACMQYFYLGNKHFSVATIISAIASLILLPEYFFSFIKAFRRGQKALPIGKLYLGDLLHCNTKELQDRFRIETIQLK
jgi:ubiquinone biosynthesis protein Coq4